ncbi:MAG: DUF1572 domain-containing protein [Phycisphaerae bacterium]
MNVPSQIAKHFREVIFEGNWTASNLKTQLADVTWEEAAHQRQPFHSIATLTFHINYYVEAVTRVLQGGPLEAHDQFSFDAPEIKGADDWIQLRDHVFSCAETFAALVEKMPDERVWQDIDDPKYGIYYRNLHGIIEHTHYHLGQIAILKKLLRSP